MATSISRWEIRIESRELLMSYMQSPKPPEMLIHYTKASIPSLQAQETVTKHVPVEDDLIAALEIVTRTRPCRGRLNCGCAQTLA